MYFLLYRLTYLLLLVISASIKTCLPALKQSNQHYGKATVREKEKWKRNMNRNLDYLVTTIFRLIWWFTNIHCSWWLKCWKYWIEGIYVFGAEHCALYQFILTHSTVCCMISSDFNLDAWLLNVEIVNISNQISIIDKMVISAKLHINTRCKQHPQLQPLKTTIRF